METPKQIRNDKTNRALQSIEESHTRSFCRVCSLPMHDSDKHVRTCTGHVGLRPDLRSDLSVELSGRNLKAAMRNAYADGPNEVASFPSSPAR